MEYDAYPAQEPLTDFGRSYFETASALSAGLVGEEFPTDDGADPYQRIMVFPAENPTGDVIAFMHGGGWTNGYKELMCFLAPPLTARGITFATIGYRLAPKHVFPAGWHDAALAIKWLYENVRRFGGDPARIFVGGHSAGGHYAALLAVRDGWQAGLGLPGDVIRGCLPISGSYDFLPGNGMAVRPRFLGDPDAFNDVAATPLFDIRVDCPPFLMAWGSEDFPHLITQAEKMALVLKSKGISCGALVLEEQGHLGACYNAAEENGPWLAAVTSWIAAR